MSNKEICTPEGKANSEYLEIQYSLTEIISKDASNEGYGARFIAQIIKLAALDLESTLGSKEAGIIIDRISKVIAKGQIKPMPDMRN